MSDDITVKVLREQNQVYASVAGQLDKMSVQEAATYGGAAPYMRYWFFVEQALTILADDVLVDLNNIDPKTGTNTIYTAVSDGEDFPDQHVEVALDKVRGV
ncbi:MAG TPA: hypothetical protein VJ761_05010 [Ktedonobacteraceae bacterium]|nr:hypothetical protein [Ktedonobacteraceae bacterium]